MAAIWDGVQRWIVGRRGNGNGPLWEQRAAGAEVRRPPLFPFTEASRAETRYDRCQRDAEDGVAQELDADGSVGARRHRGSAIASARGAGGRVAPAVQRARERRVTRRLAAKGSRAPAAELGRQCPCRCAAAGQCRNGVQRQGREGRFQGHHAPGAMPLNTESLGRTSARRAHTHTK